MRKLRLISVLALALALYTAATVGTASGALAETVSAGAWNCKTLASSVLARGGLARGGVVREPDLAQVHKDLPASAKGKAGAASPPACPCTSTSLPTGRSEA